MTRLSIIAECVVEVPEGLQRLTSNLRTLNLSDNKITTIPTFIGNFRQLKMLNVSNNHIGRYLGHCHKLTRYILVAHLLVTESLVSN